MAAAIGYAARKGRPKSFNRDMFVLAFVATVMVSGSLMVYAQRMDADVRTRQCLLQVACFELGAVLFGIAGGCGVGIFTYRPKSSTLDPPK
jgi:Na+/H+-translocating membrane pyrophosphatase